jgi:hypothetical protein
VAAALAVTCFAVALIPAARAAEVVSVRPGPSPEVLAESNPELQEIGQVRIENQPGGAIAVKVGDEWRRLGSVLRYTAMVDRTSFTASKWGRASAVVATAVNALHVKVAHNDQEDRGIVFSLLPREFAPGSARPFATRSPDSSIYTDIPAGTGIFGGDFAPFVGNPVFVMRGDEPAPLPPDYVPALGDVLLISIRRPTRYPSQIVFENRFQGLIYLQYPDGNRKPIGAVLRPVEGVGRFPGGLYAGIGRLRANHPGVVDICTSLSGEVGGFQILPAGHAMSPEMSYVATSAQWMVVGPLDAREPTWEGIAPLFMQYLRPKYDARDLYAEDWDARLLGRLLVEVEIGGRWQAMPHFGLDPDLSLPLPRWATHALQDVEAIRILFPLD